MKSKMKKYLRFLPLMILLEPPLRNETSEDETLHEEMGRNEFENSYEDQIMQEHDPD